MRFVYTSPGRKIVVYPNVVELWVDEVRVVAYTPEEWAAMVSFVGIRGLFPEPDDIERVGAMLHRQEVARRAAAFDVTMPASPSPLGEKRPSPAQ